jgi:nitronate monooxygenase
MQAPVGPAATPELVRAVTDAGGLGTLAAAWTPLPALREQVRRLASVLEAPFCVNLVLAFDQRERLKLALDEGAPVISFSWGVDGELIRMAHEAGAFVLVQVGDRVGGTAAADAGADGLFVQGIEAGGHVQAERQLVELLRQIRPQVNLPLVAAGGIADPASIRAARSAGADAIACGTAFLAAEEADVHPIYLDRLIEAASADTVLTTLTTAGLTLHTASSGTRRSLPGRRQASPSGADQERENLSRPAEASRCSATKRHNRHAIPSGRSR